MWFRRGVEARLLRVRAVAEQRQAGLGVVEDGQERLHEAHHALQEGFRMYLYVYLCF